MLYIDSALCELTDSALCGITDSALDGITDGALGGMTTGALFKNAEDVSGSLDVSGSKVFCSVRTGGGC